MGNDKMREQMRDQMELDQKRVFCKASCTKIDQGLAELGLRSGERAIWELFQNARDQAQKDSNGEKKAYIKMTLTPTEFIFSHQGRPFDHDSLTSLVMQVSSQSKENDETVGQYGTGFLTTHVFGRKLYVSGSMDLSNYEGGGYADIDRFTIDRTYSDMTEFVDKVARQLKSVTEYSSAEQTSTCRQWTELCYDLSSAEGASETATSAMISAVDVIPYVMTMNDPIVSVVMENQITGDTYHFEKEQMPDEADLKVMQVSVIHNGILHTRKIYYLQSEDGEDIAILPLRTANEAQSLTGIAKLFVFFPLLGTEDFGMDVIFHSKKFIPLTERDGIHLPVANANVRAKYEQNIQVLESLTKMVQNYYLSHAEEISGWAEIAKLTFDCEHHKEEITRNYIQSFKKQWSDFFQNLLIVDFKGERVCVAQSDVRFFAPGIVSEIEENPQSEIFDTLYSAASVGYNLVSMEEALRWSQVVASWDSFHSSLIEIEDIARKLSECSEVSSDVLRAFDTYLSDRGLDSLFAKYNLIPNRQGEKMPQSELRDASTIPAWLSEMVKEIVPEKVALFADDSFVEIVKLTKFTRNDLRDAISSRLRTLRQEYLDKGISYGNQVVNTLFDLSSVFATETASVVRRKAMETISEHLDRTFESRLLPCLDSDERDLAELPFKHLVECMLLEISQADADWVNSNINYIISLHSNLSNWAEYYNRNTKDGLCTKYGAFPNRNAQPCLARELEVGIDIPEELAALYEVVLNKDLNERLVDERFNDFYDFPNLSAKDVATEIESKLEEGNYQHSAVLDVINKLDDGAEWNQWFPRIASKKAELFLGSVAEACKESIFKLMKVNDAEKLNQLAKLSDEINIDEIIEKGRSVLIQQKNQATDFNFKLDLGKYVENTIQQHLSDALISENISVCQEDYGCDLSICKNGEPIYYIEVKSRWSKDQSVMMSPLQMRTSVEYPVNYALCCVDMSHFDVSEAEEHQYPSLEEVLPYIKVLSDIGDLNSEICNVADGTSDRPVYIGGDYKCVVPQSTIKKHGQDFNSLIQLILKKVL